MQESIKLVYYIAPSIQFKGRMQLTLAIYRTKQIMTQKPFLEIYMTKDVYPYVAKESQKSLQAAERAIYRAVELCWLNGHNENLNQIIGRDLPVRPSPTEFILYCAYYLIYKKPYHHAIKSGLPLLF